MPPPLLSQPKKPRWPKPATVLVTDGVEQVPTAFDCNQTLPSNVLSELSQKGFTTAIRYYRPATANADIKGKWPPMTIEEANRLIAAGFDIVAIFQHVRQPNIDQFSSAEGQKWAWEARKYAEDQISQPYGTAIYFAVDQINPSEKQVEDKILPYFEAVYGVMRANRPEGFEAAYRVGVYGSGLVCAKLLNAGYVDYTWLSNSTSFTGYQDFAASGKWNLMQGLQKPFGKTGFLIDPDFIGKDGCGSFYERKVTQ